jgi:hypothetical protein
MRSLALLRANFVGWTACAIKWGSSGSATLQAYGEYLICLYGYDWGGNAAVMVLANSLMAPRLTGAKFLLAQETCGIFAKNPCEFLLREKLS